MEDTKKRIKESESRIDNDLEAVVLKKYWTEAREQLRRQVRAGAGRGQQAAQQQPRCSSSRPKGAPAGRQPL